MLLATVALKKLFSFATCEEDKCTVSYSNYYYCCFSAECKILCLESIRVRNYSVKKKKRLLSLVERDESWGVQK